MQTGLVERRVKTDDGYEVQEEQLIEHDESEDALVGLAGLRPRLQRVFESYNMTIALDRSNIADKVFSPELSRLDEDDLVNIKSRSDQVHALGLICDKPEGFVIDAPTGWGKSFLLRQAVKILPDKRILIAAPGKDIVLDMHSRLKPIVRELGLVGAGSDYVSRVTVCTMESLHKARQYEWDLLLGDEAHRFASPVACKELAAVAHNTKCVGFSASPDGRADGADLVTEALFGPVAYRVGYQTGVQRGSVVPINVLAYHVDFGPTVRKGTPTFIRNRMCVWKNPHRNGLIADIANALDPDTQVLIVVGTAEHALELRKLLPHFEVVFTSVTSKSAVSKLKKGEYQQITGLRKTQAGYQLLDGRREALRQAFQTGELKHAIATSIWDTGVDFRGLEVLIRADCMGSAIKSTQTPGRLSRTDGKKTCAYLVDFVDKFDQALHRRWQARKKVYEKHGWPITNLYPYQTSLGAPGSIKPGG